MVLEAVKQNGYALLYADKSLKRNRSFVREAMINNVESFKYADEAIKSDKNMALMAVRKKSELLEWVNDILKRDREIIVEALKENYKGLKFADNSIKRDKKFMMECVKQYPCSLEYAHETLKRDKEIVMMAVKKDRYSFQYADESIRRDKQFIEELASKGVIIFQICVHKVLKRDKNRIFGERSLKRETQYVLHTEKQQNDEKVEKLTPVKRDGGSLLPSSAKLLKKEIYLKIAKEDHSDNDKVLEAVKIYSNLYRDKDAHSLNSSDGNLQREMFLSSGDSLQSSNGKLQREMFLSSGDSLQSSDSSLQRNKEIILDAVHENTSAEVNFNDVILETVKRNGDLNQCGDTLLNGDDGVVLEAVKKKWTCVWRGVP